jgi:ferredoxin
MCTLKLEEGSKVMMDTPLGLLKEMQKKGYALSCCSYPRSDIVCSIQDEDGVGNSLFKMIPRT